MPGLVPSLNSFNPHTTARVTTIILPIFQVRKLGPLREVKVLTRGHAALKGRSSEDYGRSCFRRGPCRLPFISLPSAVNLPGPSHREASKGQSGGGERHSQVGVGATLSAAAPPGLVQDTLQALGRRAGGWRGKDLVKTDLDYGSRAFTGLRNRRGREGWFGAGGGLELRCRFSRPCPELAPSSGFSPPGSSSAEQV